MPNNKLKDESKRKKMVGFTISQDTIDQMRKIPKCYVKSWSHFVELKIQEHLKLFR